jgi:outer membrane protein TolC
LQAGHAATVTGLASTQSVPGGVQTADQFTGGAYAELRLPLYAGGSISGRIEAATRRAEASRGDLELVRQELKRAALTAYAGVVAAHRQLTVVKHALDRARALSDLAVSRRDSGVGSPADVARSRLNVLRREEDVAARQTDLDVAQSVLRAALLLPTASPVEPANSLEALASMRAERAGVLPEIEQLRAQMAAARADVAVARAATFRPSRSSPSARTPTDG